MRRPFAEVRERIQSRTDHPVPVRLCTVFGAQQLLGRHAPRPKLARGPVPQEPGGPAGLHLLLGLWQCPAARVRHSDRVHRQVPRYRTAEPSSAGAARPVQATTHGYGHEGRGHSRGSRYGGRWIGCARLRPSEEVKAMTHEQFASLRYLFQVGCLHGFIICTIIDQVSLNSGNLYSVYHIVIILQFLCQMSYKNIQNYEIVLSFYSAFLAGLMQQTSTRMQDEGD